MNVGLWMSPDVLAHKLEAQDEKNTDAAWNVAQLPVGLGRPGEVDRLFIASDRKWRGYFVLRKDALWSPEDRRAPFTILFDTRTWKEIAPLSVARFRGIRALTEAEIASLLPPGE